MNPFLQRVKDICVLVNVCEMIKSWSLFLPASLLYVDPPEVESFQSFFILFYSFCLFNQDLSHCGCLQHDREESKHLWSPPSPQRTGSLLCSLQRKTRFSAPLQSRQKLSLSRLRGAFHQYHIRIQCCDVKAFLLFRVLNADSWADVRNRLNIVEKQWTSQC